MLGELRQTAFLLFIVGTGIPFFKSFEYKVDFITVYSSVYTAIVPISP